MVINVDLKSLSTKLTRLIETNKEKELSKDVLSELDRKIKRTGKKSLIMAFEKLNSTNRSVIGNDLVPLRERASQIEQEYHEAEMKLQNQKKVPLSLKKALPLIRLAYDASIGAKLTKEFDSLNEPSQGSILKSSFFYILDYLGAKSLLEISSVRPGYYLVHIEKNWKKDCPPFGDHTPVYNLVIKIDDTTMHQIKFIVKDEDRYQLEDGTLVNGSFKDCLKRLEKNSPVPALTSLDYLTFQQLLGRSF